MSVSICFLSPFRAMLASSHHPLSVYVSLQWHGSTSFSAIFYHWPSNVRNVPVLEFLDPAFDAKHISSASAPAEPTHQSLSAASSSSTESACGPAGMSVVTAHRYIVTLDYPLTIFLAFAICSAVDFHWLGASLETGGSDNSS